MTKRLTTTSLLATAACLALLAGGCESDSASSTTPPAGTDAGATTDTGGGGPTGTLAAFCGAVGDTGCCQGTRLLWCEGGAAVALECATNGCGWDATGGFYNCYNSGADPGGKAIACPNGPADGACVPSCSGRCGGDDGCGGQCRCSDLIGQSCVGGVCAKAATATECETVGHVGCCAGGTRRYCAGGTMESQTCADGCGWTAAGWYDCGGGGADPSGVWPAACP